MAEEQNRLQRTGINVAFSPTDIEKIITALTVAAGFSLLIERAIEWLKHIIDGSNINQIRHQQLTSQFNNARAERTLNKYHNLLQNLEQKTQDFSAVVNTQDDKYQIPVALQTEEQNWDESQFEKYSSIALSPIKPPLKADLLNAQLNLFYLLSAVGMAIATTAFMKLHLLSMLLGKHDISVQAQLLDEIISGIVIAGGAQPLHVLITFLTTKKMQLDDISAQQKTNSNVISEAKGFEQNVNATAATTPFSIIYRGGVNPDALELSHLRQQPLEMIIYHHTAMHSELPFDDIINEYIDNKKWLTAYHAIVMPDGTIRPFCRWDRTGNHCIGFNQQSLAVALHGNFHAMAEDEFSNHDGRYGNKKPTSAQIQSTARLIELWIQLYAIPVNFNHNILPHCDVIPGRTVCPGNLFPHDALQQAIIRQHQQSLSLKNIGKLREQFQLQPYVMNEE